MDLTELKTRCEDARRSPIACGKLRLMVRGKWPANGSMKRLFGRKGPYGLCIAEHEDAVLCVFDAQQILDYLQTQSAGSRRDPASGGTSHE